MKPSSYAQDLLKFAFIGLIETENQQSAIKMEINERSLEWSDGEAEAWVADIMLGRTYLHYHISDLTGLASPALRS
ncbi:MAG: hypothetical protein IBX56_19980 [Methylomicrobium sp.]|nr:hypothetical protein [Methylomicrobium sp.]